MRQAPGPWWLGSVSVGVLACLSLLVVPPESTAWTLVARVTGVCAIAAFAVATARMPARTKLVWWLMWTYAAMTVLGDIVYDVQEQLLDEAPFPGPADVLYLLAYVAAIGALTVLVRRVIPNGDRDAWLDTAIISIAVATVIGYVVARPALLHSEQPGGTLAIALIYPFLDIVVLAGLARVILAGVRATVAITLLAMAFLVTLTADLIYDVMVSNGTEDSSRPVVDVLLLAGIVLLAAASWAPDARTVDTPSARSSAPYTPGRLTGLAVGMLTLPTLLVVAVWDNLAARRVAIAAIVVLLLAIWRLERALRTVRVQYEALGHEARTDALTGLPNRRTLDYEVVRAVDLASRTGTALTVAMLDLDHFKSYNDDNGHQAGDRLLALCAHSWRDALPANAFLARYGGEEFVALLPGLDAAAALPVLERLRESSPGHRTVSIGYAVREDRESASSVLRRADAALYDAKELGRDRIIAAW